MSKFLTLAEAVARIEEWQEEEFEGNIDLVELPPETVDNLTDVEEINDENVVWDASSPDDVPGFVEICAHNDIDCETDNRSIRKVAVEWSRKPL